MAKPAAALSQPPKPVAKKTPPKALREAMAQDVKAQSIDMVQLRALLDQMRDLDNDIATHSEQIAQLAKTRDSLSREIIPNLFDTAGGIAELRLDDGRKVKVSTTYHPTVLAANIAKLHAWMEKNGFGALIKAEYKLAFGMGEEKNQARLVNLLSKNKFAFAAKQAIAPQTLKAWVRERMENEQKLPSMIDPNPIRETIVK